MSTNERFGTAVITGAGSGIGAAVARALGQRGHGLVLVGRRLAPLQRALEASGGRGLALALDVRDDAAVARAVLSAEAELGPIEVAIPGAGVARVGAFTQLPASAFRETLDTNLVGVANLFRAVLPGMIERGRGQLVPLLSVASRHAFPGWSAYCASKWGLLGLVEALREDLKGSGVRICAVTPGATASPLWNEVPGEWDHEAMIPAEEVARAVVWALEAGDGVAVEEIRLQPPGGNL